MNDIFLTIKEQFLHNQFFSGGMVLGVIGGIIAYFRRIPGRSFMYLRGKCMVHIDIQDQTEAFEWLRDWLAMHPYSLNRNRNFTVTAKRSAKRGETQPDILLSPAPGRHVLWFKRRLMYVHRDRNEGDKMQAPRETFRITIFTRKRNYARLLLEEARDISCPKQERKIRIYMPRCDNWNCVMSRDIRELQSVVLEDGLSEQITEDVNNFLHKRDWYCRRGIPYRRGYLLVGPPGNGKTSLVAALASQFTMDIAILNLSDKSISDQRISHLFAELPDHCFVLIEDIDCAFVKRRKKSSSEDLSFSGLLNAIDGVAAGEGRILFMTTNHPERLDEALIREGRVDRKFQINNATKSQAYRIFRRFFPESTEKECLQFTKAVKPGKTSMAKLQGHLVKYHDNRKEAIAQAQQVLAA